MGKEDRSLLELLYSVSREVATALDLRTVLQRVLYAAVDNVGGERGSIIVLDEDGKPLDSIIMYGKRVQGDTTQQLRVTVEQGLAGWVMRNKKPALVPDTSRDKRWLRRPDDSVQESGAKTALCVPLMVREDIVGVLTLVHPTINAFGREHLDLMQAIADQTSIAILNARLYTESQRKARVMTALADSAMTINSSLQMDDVFQGILSQLIEALDVETVALALQESADGDFVFQAALGGQTEHIKGKRVPIWGGLVAKILQDKKGFVVPEVKDENPIVTRSFFDGIDSKALAIAPIQAQGKIIGMLEAINPNSGSFDPDALLVMTGIGSMAGTTIQNAQFLEQVEETQKRYRELFHDSIDPIIVSDWDGNILEANKNLFSLSGCEEDMLRTMKIEELHQINRDKVGQNFENIRDDRTVSYEANFQATDGTEIPVEVYLRSAHLGEEKAIFWSFRDIRERKELDDLRNDLTSMIYHDLRSPLGNIISSLGVLDTMLEEKDEAVEALLQIANNSSGRLQRLIASLLDINRLEMGQTITSQRSVSSEKLIEDALLAISPSIVAREQRINKEVEENLPNLWVDEDMIRRVLTNLVENASKFTQMKGEITIRAKANGDWVQFSVADNGMGISPEDRDRVFEKFARSKRGQKVSGLGLGLAFCRLAVEEHAGKIWIDEERKDGTQFNITLPIAKNEKQEA